MRQIMKEENESSNQVINANIDDKFKQFQESVDNLRKELFEHVKAELKKKDDALEERFKVIMEKVDRRGASSYAPSAASYAASAASAASTGPSDFGSAIPGFNKRMRFEPSATFSSGARNRASSAPGSSVNPNKVWVAGFPRPLLGMMLRTFLKDVVSAHMGSAMASQCDIDCRNGKKFGTIEFPSRIAANTFLDAVSGGSVKWTDPRDKSQHTIRLRKDKTAEQRDMGKLTSKLWTKTKALFEDKGTWQRGFSMGTMNSTEFFASDSADFWILYNFGKDEGNHYFATVPSESAAYAKWQVTAEELTAIATAAVTEAAAEAALA